MWKYPDIFRNDYILKNAYKKIIPTKNVSVEYDILYGLYYYDKFEIKESSLDNLYKKLKLFVTDYKIFSLSVNNVTIKGIIEHIDIIPEDDTTQRHIIVKLKDGSKYHIKSPTDIELL